MLESSVARFPVNKRHIEGPRKRLPKLEIVGTNKKYEEINQKAVIVPADLPLTIRRAVICMERMHPELYLRGLEQLSEEHFKSREIRENMYRLLGQGFDVGRYLKLIRARAPFNYQAQHILHTALLRSPETFERIMAPLANGKSIEKLFAAGNQDIDAFIAACLGTKFLSFEAQQASLEEEVSSAIAQTIDAAIEKLPDNSTDDHDDNMAMIAESAVAEKWQNHNNELAENAFAVFEFHRGDIITFKDEPKRKWRVMHFVDDTNDKSSDPRHNFGMRVVDCSTRTINRGKTEVDFGTAEENVVRLFRTVWLGEIGKINKLSNKAA